MTQVLRRFAQSIQAGIVPQNRPLMFFYGSFRINYTLVALPLDAKLLKALKSTLFRDITMHSSLKVNRRFGGTYRLHFQGRRWMRYVPTTRQLTFNGLRGVISQKIVRFITTAVRTSNPTLKVPLNKTKINTADQSFKILSNRPIV
jgi:hypothetical protein